MRSAGCCSIETGCNWLPWGAAISPQHGELAAGGKCPSGHAKEAQGVIWRLPFGETAFFFTADAATGRALFAATFLCSYSFLFPSLKVYFSLSALFCLQKLPPALLALSLFKSSDKVSFFRFGQHSPFHLAVRFVTLCQCREMGLRWTCSALVLLKALLIDNPARPPHHPIWREENLFWNKRLKGLTLASPWPRAGCLLQIQLRISIRKSFSSWKWELALTPWL